MYLATLAMVFASSAWAAPKYKVLHAFGLGKDGAGLYDSLTLDKKGNLYGTTAGGGGQGCNGTGCGTVFELSPNLDGHWAETVLHSFNGKDEGAFPTGGVVFDAAGNLYGMTYSAGPSGFGSVFGLTPGTNGWSLSVLHDGGSEANLTWTGRATCTVQCAATGSTGRALLASC